MIRVCMCSSEQRCHNRRFYNVSRSSFLLNIEVQSLLSVCLLFLGNSDMQLCSKQLCGSAGVLQPEGDYHVGSQHRNALITAG